MQIWRDFSQFWEFFDSSQFLFCLHFEKFVKSLKFDSKTNMLRSVGLRPPSLRFRLKIFIFQGRPCKIVEMSTSKTGKHGHAKVHMVALDIFTTKKYEDICPSTHNMDVPNVSRKDYQLCDIDDDYLSLMDDGGDMREDLKVPDGDLGEEIRNAIADGKEILVRLINFW